MRFGLVIQQNFLKNVNSMNSISLYIKESVKYILRSYPIIFSYIRKVNKLYRMTNDELHNYQEKQFLMLFEYAYDNSPFYKQFYKEAGISKNDIKCLEDIKKLPILTKDILKKHSDDILTAAKWKLLRGTTSGTTGTPLTFYWDRKCVLMSQAYLFVSRLRNGFKLGQPIVSLRGKLDRNQLSLKLDISNTLYLSSYCINEKSIEIYYNKIINHHPVAIEGYPSSLYSLALFMEKAGLKLKIPVAFTSSETLFHYQRNLIEKQLGTEIYDYYGMGERTISLYESNDHCGYYEWPGYSINEYYEDGEICTSLINKGFPLIRYRSNDIIELAESNNENPRIIAKRILGRVDDFLICKDGSRVTRVDFVEDGKHIKACQWIQKEKGKLLILIVPDDGFSDKDKEFVLDETIKRVGENNMDIEVKLAKLDELRLTKSGKFRLIVNEIPKENNYA